MTKNFGIDFYRGLVIFLMFITHGYRLFLPGSPAILPNSLPIDILNFFLAIEPYTSASFLFLVGVSISLVRNRIPQKSSLSIIKRAGQLYLISMALFIFEKGWQFPTIFTSSGILSVIAISMILTLLFSFINKDFLIYSISIVSILFLAILQYTINYQVSISGFNSGPGGLVPLFLFSLWGYYFGEKMGDKSLEKTAPLFLSIFFASFFFSQDWTHSFSETYLDYLGDPNIMTWINHLFHGGSNLERQYAYWNHSPLGMVRVLFFNILSLVAFLKIRSDIKGRMFFRFFALMGSKALWGYIMHLIIIGAFHSFGLAPSSVISLWFFILGLSFINFTYASIKTKNRYQDY